MHGRGADRSKVRSRFILKLISLSVFMILTVIGFRSCSASSPSSPLNPVNVARNGIAGVCADQQAEAEAANPGESAQPPGTAVSPGALAQLQAGDPGGVQGLEQALGGNLNCPTTTTAAGRG